MERFKMRYYVLLGAAFFANSVQAADIPWGTDCKYSVIETAISFPAGIKITLDPNVPVGTTFFEHFINTDLSGAIACDTALSYSYAGQYAYESGGSFVLMSGNGLTSSTGTYPVYKTNIRGVGMVIRSGSRAFPYTSTPTPQTNQKLSYRWGTTFDIDIIKYGDIPLGASTVNVNSLYLPVINRNVVISNSSNTTKLKNGTVTLQRITMGSATFNIVSSTCNTPDVAVDLGKRKIVDTANREGGQFATPWVDASIHLTGCPVFYGTGERSNDVKSKTRNNILTLTLQPGNATTSSEGMMPVDTTGPAASGVGIQLAYGTATSAQPVNFSGGQASAKYTMSSSQGATYTIPLVARYKQTASSLSDVKSGPANGKITYLINYF
ncbi:hypothetical protein [Metakosakonia massiliensis]|uniref:Fimbrial-type adhesion domain-containing protein n=1 Tax=Phytobacter massiliensis TaxID=1485952 RepID=A0A6N3GY45_9ENTR